MKGTTNRPLAPGFSIRKISALTFQGSWTCSRTLSQITKSKVASPNGREAAVAWMSGPLKACTSSPTYRFPFSRSNARFPAAAPTAPAATTATAGESSGSTSATKSGLRRSGSLPSGSITDATPEPPPRRCRSERHALHLAARAVEARPADDDPRADRLCAAATRLAGAVVDAMLELEPARAAEAAATPGDGRAPAPDRVLEHGAGRA